MTPDAHKRYLDYRERHAYFGRRLPLLSMQDFVDAEREIRSLEDKPRRDDEEGARLGELGSLLLRD